MSILGWLSPSSEKKALSETKNICYHIEGFLTCPYFHAATDLGDALAVTNKNLKIEVRAFAKEQWGDHARQLRQEIPGASAHMTSPLVYEGCDATKYKFVGGYSDFAKVAKERHGAEV